MRTMTAEHRVDEVSFTTGIFFYEHDFLFKT